MINRWLNTPRETSTWNTPLNSTIHEVGTTNGDLLNCQIWDPDRSRSFINISIHEIAHLHAGLTSFAALSLGQFLSCFARYETHINTLSPTWYIAWPVGLNRTLYPGVNLRRNQHKNPVVQRCTPPITRRTRLAPPTSGTCEPH